MSEEYLRPAYVQQPQILVKSGDGTHTIEDSGLELPSSSIPIPASESKVLYQSGDNPPLVLQHRRSEDLNLWFVPLENGDYLLEIEYEHRQTHLGYRIPEDDVRAAMKAAVTHGEWAIVHIDDISMDVLLDDLTGVGR